jgi:iron(III) transport system permease protein
MQWIPKRASAKMRQQSMTTLQFNNSPVGDRQNRLVAIMKDFSAFKAIGAVVVMIFAFLSIYPLSRVLLRLVYNNGQFDFSPLRSIFHQSDVGILVLNTLFAVGLSAIVSLVFGSILAWLNERTDARIGVVTDALPLVPFLIPPIAGAIGWVLLLSDRAGLLNVLFRWLMSFAGVNITIGPFNIYTWTGLIFVYVIYSVPYVYVMMSAGFQNMDTAIEEQSRICGSATLRTMRLVTIPAVRPSLGASVLLLIWFGFSLYSIPAIIGRDANIEVLSVRLVTLLTFTYPPEMTKAIALGMIVIFAVGTAWYFQSRILRSGRHSTISGKGLKVTRIELGRFRWLGRGIIIGYIIIAAGLPLLALLIVALNGYWTPNIQWTKLNLDSFYEVLFEDRITITALRNSISLGIVGATIGMIAAAILALFVQRSGPGVARVVDAAVKFPATISTIVLAVGFVLAFGGYPFYLNGTYLILLLAYLALYMPQGSVAADAAAAQVGRELIEASRVSGAGGGRTFRRISLPLMMAGLISGWALMFVRMLGDLTASSILAGTSNPVVGFRILEVYQGASFAKLAALSTVMTLISVAVVVLLLAFGRTRMGGAVGVPSI